MKQSTLANWLKFIIIGIGICGLIVYGFLFPALADSTVSQFPEFAYAKNPWLIFLGLTGIPCYAVLFLAWKVAVNIGNDRSFSMENAKIFTWISMFAAGDTFFFFAGNILFLFLNMNHPGIVFVFMIIVFIGIAISIAAAILSHLVRKAADLQEQSDLTI